MKPVNDAEDVKTEHQRQAVEKVTDIFKDYSTSERAKFYSHLEYIPEIDKSMSLVMVNVPMGDE